MGTYRQSYTEKILYSQGFCELFGTFRNFVQQGHKLCLSLLVFLGLSVIVEGQCFVCSAGIIKPLDVSVWNVWPDFQNFAFKFRNTPDGALPIKNEITWLFGFNFTTKQFDITSEPLSFHSGISTKAKPVANQYTNKATEQPDEISHGAGRMRYGLLMPCHPSRFLKELPPELVEDADAGDRQSVNPDAGKKCSTSAVAPSN